jgi:hypothetical protein
MVAYRTVTALDEVRILFLVPNLDGGISGDITCLESKSGIRVVGSIPTPSAKFFKNNSF